MSDRNIPRKGAIGDWTDHPPEVTVVKLPPIEERDPRDYDEEIARDIVIRKRRAAGLPDYPPKKKD